MSSTLFAIKKPQDVNTALVTSLGLIGGWVSAKETGIRPLGGAILLGAGGWAARSWLKKTNPATTAALLGIYTAGFGLSHPLAKKIGPWPSVLSVTALSAGAAHFLSDAR
ncbi:hypothetical protein EML15_07785 [Corynebacterium sp. sy017]|uniref:hypothetical protein n=1 Tax=unclassified Corynebacterium TaxID=2624378 RepID=UPI001185CD41|nr:MULTISPECIES: hypothetical protein [unclassified Corynebacterium]MBP3089043.1 hypothetical protein [Corynebacterium sp. sy017]TSD91361.1 hypothetical protein ELY17_07795 [Corynebacterium sp. SY003]